jgi:phosphoribosylformylglycinamidine synthase
MVNVCILTGYGINSDYESAFAFQKAGAESVKRVHVNKFIKKMDDLENYQILMFPGGFAFGDDLGSGRVLANKFRFSLRNQLTNFIEEGKLILGVCNGFQILVKMGILPAMNKEFYKQTVSLIKNKSGQFEDRWVNLKPHKTVCVWTKKLKNNLDLPVRHGEGQFVVKEKHILEELRDKKMVALTYHPNNYPFNPNGSKNGIAGICDESGRIFGMMPHPECHIMKYHHPQWTRGFEPSENGLIIFKNGVDFARENL